MIPDHVPADLHQPAVAPAYTHDELLELARADHDHDTGESVMNRVDIVTAAVRMQQTFCHHCRPDFRLRPLSRNGWAVEWFHAPACPEVDA